MSLLCALLQNGSKDGNSSLVSNESVSDGVALLQRISYAYITPCIIACGVFGDIMTVSILTHPLLRRGSVIYTYLTFLAITDLCTQLSVIPMVMWLLDWKLCSYTAAIFYAHIGFPLANAFMGASVWIVVFLTFSQYMAVCHPFHNSNLRSRKMCFGLTGLAYVLNFGIYAPWGARKYVHPVPEPENSTYMNETSGYCKYIACEEPSVVTAQWYDIYQWGREAISRFIPFVFVAYFNISILMTYRVTKRDRLNRMADSQKRSLYEKSEHEEKRLFMLLVSIVTLFFFCTIPAAPLTILVKDAWSQHLPFQIIRSIINILEFTKFALNFYFYCLINPDIRRICAHIIMCRKMTRPARVKGKAVSISQYTKSTKSTMRDRAAFSDSSRRSSRVEGEFSRKSSGVSVHNTATRNLHDRRKSSNSSLHLRNTLMIANENGAFDHLTVIRESETDSISHSLDLDPELPHERTSML